MQNVTSYSQIALYHHIHSQSYLLVEHNVIVNTPVSLSPAVGPAALAYSGRAMPSAGSVRIRQC